MSLPQSLRADVGEGPLPSAIRPGGGPGCRASQGLFPPARGRTLGAARQPESRCAQVRPGVGPQCLVHIHAGRGPASALPGVEDWPESGGRPPPIPREPSLRSRPVGPEPWRGGARPGGGAAGARGWRPCEAGRLALYVNSSGSAPCSQRRR